MTRVLVQLRATGRLVRALAHLVNGWLTLLIVFPRLTPEGKNERIRVWAIDALAHLAIELVVIGKAPPPGPALLVANHLSWLDIVVMLAAQPARFVAKSDIAHWPLVGRLARGGGTLFIQRESRRDAQRVVHHMAESLKAGDRLAVFPEGTTSDGADVLPFHANLFQAAISADVPVVPVALRFEDAVSGQRSSAACYVDDDTLHGSLWRTVSAPALRVVLVFGEPQAAQGRDRRTWAGDVRNAVQRLRE